MNDLLPIELAGLLSGDAPLQAAASASMKARGVGTRPQGKMYLGNGFVYDPATGQTAQDPAYAAYVKERDAAALERARAGAALRNQRPMPKTFPTEGGQVVAETNPRAEGGVHTQAMLNIPPPLSASDRGKARETERLQQEALDLMGQVHKNPGAIDPWVDIASEWMRGGDFTKIFVPTIEQQAYTPEQTALRARVANFESDLSKLAAGLAVTGFEMEDRKKWSPFAPGLTPDQVQSRLKNISNRLGAQAQAAYGKIPKKSMSYDEWKAQRR